jgi:multidrug efflux pump subunit AcrA (membrane-fusion protein)
MIRRLAIAALVLALAAAAAATLRSSTSIARPTAVVERGTFIDFLPVRGEIRPERSIVLTAPSAGGGDMQIIQLVANGATVRAGDTIAVFDTTNQQRTLEQKTSELKQARAELERAHAEQERRVRAAAAELEQAKSTAARHRLDLDAAELLSKVEAEKRAITVANAERLVRELEDKLAGEREITAADLAIAQQKVDKMRYDVGETERMIRALTLTTPRDGMVSLLPNFRAGGPMARTSPEFRRGDRAWAGAAIAELPDLASVRMALRVDEADRARLASGGATRVRVDAVPDREFAARIAEISLVATPDFTSFPPVRNFDVSVALVETDPRLRTGMSATARIELDRLDDALMVPASAVVERDGTTSVFVVSGNALQQRRITVLRRGRERIAVERGLSAGERVAIEPPPDDSGREP